MPTPTPKQIQTVKTNLARMQAYSDYVFAHGGDRVMNAYMLLTEPDTSDPGLTVALNLMEGGFWAAAAIEGAGPIGGFAASFLSGMLSAWASDAPPDLRGQIASYFSRLDKTATAVDTQLATYHADVLGNWDTSFTFQGSTVTLGDFSTDLFPVESDPSFMTMANSAILTIDKAIWQQMLVDNFVVTSWVLASGAANVLPDSNQNDPPTSLAQKFYKNNPAYYWTWSWHVKNGCGDSTGWAVDEYSIGTGATIFSDNSLNLDSCNYIFQDSTPGVITNSDGLWTREYAFTSLGMKTTSRVIDTGGGDEAVTAMSPGSLRAVSEGRSLGQLVAKEGRDTIHKRIIDRAHDDPIFAHNLKLRPRPTLEEFLNVKIPETVAISVVVEDGRTFGLVVPSKIEPEVEA